MKFGFMPSFQANLKDEIAFTKNHFDYIEITLKEDLTLYSPEYISEIRETLGGFPFLGHIHWGLDFSEGNREEINKAFRSVEIFREMGAKKITIHPSNGKDRNNTSLFPEVMKNNIEALKSIARFSGKQNIPLMVENKFRPPFNRAEDFLKIVESIPNILVTLDTGHADLTSPAELGNFLNLLNRKIGHIHLHNTFEEYDHLFFENETKLQESVDNIINAGYDGTITLEVFEVLKEGKPVIPETKERNKKLAGYMNFLKTTYLTPSPRKHNCKP